MFGIVVELPEQGLMIRRLGFVGDLNEVLVRSLLKLAGKNYTALGIAMNIAEAYEEIGETMPTARFRRRLLIAITNNRRIVRHGERFLEELMAP